MQSCWHFHCRAHAPLLRHLLVRPEQIDRPIPRLSVASDRGHAVWAHSARHTRFLSVASDQNEVEIVYADRARDDWPEHHCQRLRDFPANSIGEPIGPVIVDLDCHARVALEGASNHQLYPQEGDSRRVA
jgi:hypothetical protein